MLTLALLRHAKSSWDDPALEDFDRPLAERGLAAAPLMADHMSALALRPALVVCSTSVRTRATLELVKSALGSPPSAIVYEDGLYLASASDLLARLRRIPAHTASVLMIGHNPGFHDLALLLAEPRLSDASRALVAKFPTAGLAVLTFDAVSWARILQGGGHLAHFMSPSRLKRPAPC